MRHRNLYTALALAAVGWLATTTAGFAQTPWTGRDFSALEKRAAEVVDVTLDSSMIHLASAFLADDGDDAQVKALISGLKGIYVKSFSFDAGTTYDRSVVDELLAQVPADYKPVVTVQDHSDEKVRIFVRPAGTAVGGLMIISAEPDELTLVSIDGQIDVAQLARLEGHLGIPRLDLPAGGER